MTTPTALFTRIAWIALLTFGLCQVAEAQLKILQTAGPGDDNRVFETQDDRVVIGQGGDPTNERSDTDFYIYDPNFDHSPVEPGLHFNASSADLVLGSGTNANAGDDGDLRLTNGSDLSAVSLNGSGANVTLGSAGNPGDLTLRDNSGVSSITMTGSSGTVTNSLSGNGVVKAWARINADGSIAACYRCSASGTGLVTGAFADFYEVDFTALSSDISSRPRLVTVDTADTVFQAPAAAGVATRIGDFSSVAVRFSSSSDVYRDFTIVIF